jgi:hypothetical protein
LSELSAQHWSNALDPIDWWKVLQAGLEGFAQGVASAAVSELFGHFYPSKDEEVVNKFYASMTAGGVSGIFSIANSITAGDGFLSTSGKALASVAIGTFNNLVANNLIKADVNIKYLPLSDATIEKVEKFIGAWSTRIAALGYNTMRRELDIKVK